MDFSAYYIVIALIHHNVKKNNYHRPSLKITSPTYMEKNTVL